MDNFHIVIELTIEPVKPYLVQGKKIKLEYIKSDDGYLLDNDWFLDSLKNAVNSRNLLLCSDLYSSYLSYKTSNTQT